VTGNSGRDTPVGAYESGAKLQTRVDIYEYQRPRVDFHAFALDHLDLRGGERVLDVGCGTAIALRRLVAREAGLALVGIDRSPGMVSESRAREGTGRVRWVVGDVGALPTPDHVYDVVLAMHMLYHASDVEAAVGELRRVLRPKGTLLATTLGPRHMGELHDLANEILAGARLDRPSSRFGIDDADILRHHFTAVELDRLPGELVLDAPDPLVRYLDSARDLFEPTLPPGITWARVLDHVEGRLRHEIASHGRFTVTTDSGVLVCR
jgi:SAM-dependent methyltransferase